MAIRTTCPNCKQIVSAQDEYLGKKIKCPACGVKVELVAPEEREARDRWRQEQDQRIALLEQLDRDRSLKRESAPYAVQFGTGLDRVRNYHPGAVTRFRKLRALSRFLLLVAYVLFALVLVGAGLTGFLYREGLIARWEYLALAELGWLLVLVLSFGLLKFLGEMAWLLADVGDHQLDARNLLLDLREDADRYLARSGSGPGLPKSSSSPPSSERA